MNKRALVIGGSMDGVQAALELAGRGTDVTLVETSATLHANSRGDIVAALPYMPSLLKAASHRRIKVITDASVTQIKGDKGNLRATVVKRPRHVSIDSCTSCGRCEQECPVQISPPGSNTSHKAIHRPAFGLKSVPATYTIEKKGVSPCTAACPAGVNGHGYVALIARGKFAEALDLVTEAVPFPRVLGRVCTRPCEKQCTRGKVDQAVSICALKRFVADNNSTESSLWRTQTANGTRPQGPPRVAIIGSGPAGLTAARDLARLGHKATVFEALPVAGGMIAVGMPRFRLPREVRQADIEDIIRLGIEIRTSTPVGSQLTLADLRHQGYEAILIATGAHKNQRLGIPGENLSGVLNSIALLQALNLKQPVTVGSRVVVIGGGYTAIDSARTAIRLNCDSVKVVYRRSLGEMPANPEEVAEAREEGVEIEYLAAPVRIAGEEGRVKGIECIRMMLGEPDRSGRRRPLPVEGSEFFIPADTVIVAVGQRPDLSFLGEEAGALSDGRKLTGVDHLTMSTQIPGIFAAGDVAGDPGPMIDAIAEGRRAAASIDRYLRGEEIDRDSLKDRQQPAEVNPEDVYVPLVKHQEMPCLPPQRRVGNFEEVELGLTTDMAVQEASRCLNCGGCSLCLECTRACELKAIDHQAAEETLELEIDAIIAASGTAGISLPLADSPGIYLLPPSGNGDFSAATALTARVASEMAKGQRAGKADSPAPVPPLLKPLAEPKAGVFICGCGGNISSVIDIPGVMAHLRGLDGIAAISPVGYACTAEAAAGIKEAIIQHGLSHVVVAGCACCALDQICFSCSDRRIQCKANLLGGSQPDGVIYEFVNIREHCAWAHHDQPGAATAKAISLIAAGVARARETLDINQAVAAVDRQRCRGCGTCVEVCQFEAAALEEREGGVPVARIDAALCRWCGACVAHCPSGALSQNGCSDSQIMASLEAVLAR